MPPRQISPRASDRIERLVGRALAIATHPRAAWSVGASHRRALVAIYVIVGYVAGLGAQIVLSSVR